VVLAIWGIGSVLLSPAIGFRLYRLSQHYPRPQH